MLLLRVELPDVPGSLGRLATAIGAAGGDIEAIEIVEKRFDGTAVDDVLLEMVDGAMPDSVVSACNAVEGVTVLWISRYLAGGNLFLDLEVVESLTAEPETALDRLVELLPVAFRCEWAARLKVGHRRDPHRARQRGRTVGDRPRARHGPRRPDPRRRPGRDRPDRPQAGRRARPPGRPGVPRLRAGPPRPPGRPRRLDRPRHTRSQAGAGVTRAQARSSRKTGISRSVFFWYSPYVGQVATA